MTAITDTTVLSNFAVVGARWLIQDVFDQLVLPTEVFAEIQDGLADGYHELAPLVAAVTPPAVDGWLQLVSVSAEIGKTPAKERLPFYLILMRSTHVLDQ